MKRWKYILTASVIAWGMVMRPIHATAAELTTNNSPNSQMKITATVKDQESPNYSVVIPSTLPLGKVNKVTDSVKAYEITVKTEDINGKVTVSAPEKGSLLNGDYVLSFTNDFGIQTFQSDETMMEKILAGKIYIASEDVENVPAGVYRGTTTFTITYEVINNKPVDTPTLEPTPEPTPEPIPDLNLDKNNLQDGVYSITGNMVKIDKKSKSMADNAIHHTIKLTVKDGKYYLTLDFDGLDIGGMYGYMGQLSYYLDGYTQNQYGAIQGSVLSGTIEKYQLDSSGNKISDKYGTDYPKLVSFPMIVQAVNDGFVPLQVQVPIMDTIAGAGTQQMFLALNWSTLAKTEVDNPAFDHDKSDDQNTNDGTNSGISGGGNLNGGTLGGNLSSSLPGGSLSGGLLAGGSLSGSSLSGGLVKTGDEASYLVWILADGAALYCIWKGVGQIRKRRREYKNE